MLFETRHHRYALTSIPEEAAQPARPPAREPPQKKQQPARGAPEPPSAAVPVPGPLFAAPPQPSKKKKGLPADRLRKVALKMTHPDPPIPKGINLDALAEQILSQL